MDNFINIFNSLSSLNKSKEIEIPKEVKDQYPYGQFPLQYTKSGQEKIRKQSESRFSYSDTPKDEPKAMDINQLGLLLPLIQSLSGEKKQPKDLMKIFGKILFKDNPEMEKLLSLFSGNIKSQQINNNPTNFPNTNTVNISSLKKIN